MIRLTVAALIFGASIAPISAASAPPAGYREVPASAVTCHEGAASQNYGGSVDTVKVDSLDDVSNCGGTIGHVYVRLAHRAKPLNHVQGTLVRNCGKIEGLVVEGNTGGTPGGNFIDNCGK